MRQQERTLTEQLDTMRRDFASLQAQLMQQVEQQLARMRVAAVPQPLPPQWVLQNQPPPPLTSPLPGRPLAAPKSAPMVPLGAGAAPPAADHIGMPSFPQHLVGADAPRRSSAEDEEDDGEDEARLEEQILQYLDREPLSGS